MTDLTLFAPFLGRIDALTNTGITGGKPYVEPALKNLGAIAIPIIREVISPASFRNANTEITDISVNGVRRVRAVANKFKFGERRRGLQVLRHFRAGGAMALNRTEFDKADPASKGYDLNTLVFGDSANRDKYVLPVKAGVQYSDAISLAPYADCVDDTFHNRAAEDGSLWNAAKKENSNNLFERHFVVPGTLLLQVLTLNGRTLPVEGLRHLLLCIGLAGAYGGQTSIYSVNVRNHIVGLYAAKMERAIASPYEAVKHMKSVSTAGEAVAELDHLYGETYPTRIGPEAVAALVGGLVQSVEDDDPALGEDYRASHKQAGAFFDHWFGTVPGKALARKTAAGAPATSEDA